MPRIIRRPAVESSDAPAPEARYWETRVARNGRGGRLDTIANTLKAEAGQTGIGDAAPMVLTYNVTPESGQGADLRAVEVTTSGALTATELAASTDRGIRVVVPISEPNSKYSPSSKGSKGANPAGAGIGEDGDPMYSLMASRPHAVAYEVDKERGVPNSQSVKVREIQVAGTITADGDPAEKNDRGTRVLPENVGLVRRLTPSECERLQGFPTGWTVL